MASLRDKIQADLTDAMRNKEETRKTALRMLISAIRNAEIRNPPPEASQEAAPKRSPRSQQALAQAV